MNSLWRLLRLVISRKSGLYLCLLSVSDDSEYCVSDLNPEKKGKIILLSSLNR